MIIMLSQFMLALFFVNCHCWSDSGVPCYLLPSGKDCHYRPKPDSPVCTSPEDKTKLMAGVRQVNRTLASLEQQLIRLGVIPADTSCLKLPTVDNGAVVYSQQTLAPGSTGRYVCNEGYTLSTLFGRKEFSCTEDGIWDGNVTSVPVQCQLTSWKCSQPLDVVNGNITFKDDDPANILSGDMITYTCDPGTQLKGPQYRYCQRNGNWSEEEPLCYTAIEINTTANIEAETVQNKTDSNRKATVIALGTWGTLGTVFILTVICVCFVVHCRQKPKKVRQLSVVDQPSYRRATSDDHESVSHSTPYMQLLENVGKQK